ncbi:MAG TPA: hypothetical protein VGK32_12720 [Vicinamibacterales bacterium]
MSDPLSPDDAKELVRLCEAGRLYEVEEWIRSGRSILVPKEIRKTPLGVAMSTGFHSLVELLLRHEQSQVAKDSVLREALLFDRRAFVELALTHGADIRSVPLLDVLLTADRAIVARFLELGADPVTGYPFAHAFHQLRVKTVIGSYLDCRRSRPDIAADLQEQIDIALRQFCQEGNLKWVSLLMWAGGNPRSRGPVLDDLENADNPEFHTTALEEAAWSRNVKVLKRLKPVSSDNFPVLLDKAAFGADRDTLAYLLDLGANPNDRADGGSSALDACIRYVRWDNFRARNPYGAARQPSAYKVSSGCDAIKLLLQQGAMWKPDPSTLNATRHILYRLEPEVSVELLGRLLKNENGEAAVQELLRVAQMRQHVARCHEQLSRLGLILPGRRVNKVEKEVRRDLPAWMRRFDRKTLYEEIWAEPAEKVAARYGLSGVAIAKVCRWLKIPKPPRGYWAKKAAGQRTPARPKLPQSEAKTTSARTRPSTR